jgi:hypothetical protein
LKLRGWSSDCGCRWPPPAPPPRAGGAHLIDDPGVETPGTCHLETWITGYGGGRGLVNLSPGCTREALPRLELGGAVQVLRDHPDDAIAGRPSS